MNTGDLHNFGKKVSLVRLDGKEYFLKPRPITWEWLFFSKDYPLGPILEKIEVKNFNIKQLLLNLEIQKKDENSGLSKKIEPSNSTELSHFVSYGTLLAYSYVFGLMDLLAENIIKTDFGLQVIDLEVIATQVLLPHQTLLLPYKEDIVWEKSGIAHVAKKPEDLSFSQKKIIIESFLEAMLGLIKHHKDLLKIISMGNFEKTPIRILLRFTRNYVNKIGDFLPEERIQMERGDIPYFFKFLNQDEIYFYSSQEGQIEKLELQGKLKENADQTGVAYSRILKQDILDKKIITGTLYLLKALLSSEEIEIKLSGISVSKIKNDALIHYQNQSFKCAL